MPGRVLCPAALVQCGTPPAKLRHSCLVGALIAISPIQKPVARPPGMTSVPIHLSRVVQARELHSRTSPTNQPITTMKPPNRRRMIAAHSFSPRRSGGSSACGVSAAMIASGSPSRSRTVSASASDALGSIASDRWPSISASSSREPPGRETPSGAPQALQVFGGDRMEGVGSHLSTPFASRASTESRNRAHSTTKPPSAAWPSGVRR